MSYHLGMRFRFEELEVWNLALDFVELIYKITEAFPQSERFILAQQVKRAALSVALNIAEGSGRKTKKDFAKFLRISIGSLLEVVGCERVAAKRNYPNLMKAEFDEKSKALYFKIIALEKYLRR